MTTIFKIAQAQNPKQTEDVTDLAKDWTYNEADDEYLYHVTSVPNAEQIITDGFRRGMSQTVKGGAYQNYSRGKIFFTEKSGVSTWMQKIEQHLEYSFDEPPPISVLRVPKTAFEEGVLKEDEIGTRDTHSKSWYSEKDITANTQTSLFKVAQHIKEEDYPSTDDIASYVEALKLYLMEAKVEDKELQKLIKNLPEPSIIRHRLSNAEARVLYHTIGYVWKKLTGNNIIEESQKLSKPDMLVGNYWILQKGILIGGTNHFTIIKQNFELFRTLLGINAFAMHEKVASPPNELIKLVLDHGGVRIFASKTKKIYFQLTDETYGKWANHKLRKYDFPEKIVKVIDKTKPFKGWGSGITLLLTSKS